MLLIDNIGVLVTMNEDHNSPLGVIEDATILIDGEKIFWCGKKDQQPNAAIEKSIDAQGHLVIPGLVDCHSHLIFSGSRADEFAMRMNNVSYESIMKKGLGINTTVMATRLASDQQLLDLAKKRADQIISYGVTTLEAKSGYGLSLQDELRTLRLLKQLNEHHPLDIHPTFLGAHVVPADFLGDRNQYISTVINEMLPEVASEQLAIDCDVFCENGAFTLEESLKILSSAHNLGLGLRAHVQQLAFSGGVSLVKELPIKSISHADFLTEQDIKILAQHQVIVEALPVAALFLRSQKITPVAALGEAGVKLAIATDFNPGSAMCHDLVLAARLGVVMFGFVIEQALEAITIVAAKSLGRSNIGIIKPGAFADILITNCYNVNEFFYDWTKHPSKCVIKKGEIVTK